jgi:cytoskeletal protein CcmA (bactofilin family)
VCVRDGADVQGDIYAPTVSLYEGCRFKGKIDMDSRKAQGEKSSPESKPAKTVAA